MKSNILLLEDFWRWFDINKSKYILPEQERQMIEDFLKTITGQ